MKRRMTNLDIQMVVEEINAWGRFERSRKLTWSVLERIFPFTRQTLYSKEEIRSAFESAKIALTSGKKIESKQAQGDELQIQRLKKRIKELEIQVESFQELWVRYEFNTLRHGLDPELLREGLPEKPRFH